MGEKAKGKGMNPRQCQDMPAQPALANFLKDPSTEGVGLDAIMSPLKRAYRKSKLCPAGRRPFLGWAHVARGR